VKYLSVCSGIEAATVAWHNLGWEPLGFSEIEKFPSEVLKHHYPNVKNFGDMTKYKEWKLDDSIGLLVGGTPCQSFSVAGLRKGLEDPRGNLALTYVGILDKFRPKWFIWENVPGVLSSNRGRDFGSFLGAVAELGYGWAYRVLDAQYFGVAQRRRRVFVVGCLGDWRSAAEVLFESESLRRDIKKGRKERENVTDYVAKSVGTLCARDYKGLSSDDLQNGKAIIQKVYENHPSDSRVKEMGDVCQTVTSSRGTGGGNVPFVQETYALQGTGATSQNGNGSGFKKEQSYTLNTIDVHGVAILGGQHPNASIGENLSPTLTSAMGIGGGHVPLVQAFDSYNLNLSDTNQTIKSPQGGTLESVGGVIQAIGVDTYNGTLQGNIATTMTAGMAGSTHSGPKVMVSCIGGQHPNAAIGEEISPTLTNAMGAGGGNVSLVQSYSFDSLASNSMKSSNPHSGCREVQLSKTLDTSCLNPTANQGGIAVAHAFKIRGGCEGGGKGYLGQDEKAFTISTTQDQQIAVSQPIAWNAELNANSEILNTLTRGGQGGRQEGVMQTNMAVRRLTAIECERLQGFPDNYTNIKENCPDGPRYKALGNSMAVPVMKWIGKRIQMIENE
jgi:DNA-cytosine methyltransferase